MGQTDPDVRRGEADPQEADAVLRGKYYEYCSAQLADLLLYLSPDEIFVLAEKAAAVRGRPERVSYLTMVEVATGWLAERVALPPYEVWVEDYRTNPERYEEFFIGLWQSSLPV